eukprot:Nitzschia sp. Nitz4//scaffold10_size219509//188776//191151//NITZ4_001459-RA/size219509-processed-gene-0.98-mRNA-1//1//CDS//3329533013//3762//frame0
MSENNTGLQTDAIPTTSSTILDAKELGGDVDAKTELSTSSQYSMRARSLETKSRFHAFARALIHIDYTSIQFIPALRTCAIMVIEWTVFSTGAANSAAFQMGCLLPGAFDPNGSLGLRLHLFGLAGLSIVIFGNLIPALVWESPAASIVIAFFLAVAAGYSPIFASPTIFLGMKLGAVSFALMCGISMSFGGYKEFWIPVAYSLFGVTANAIVAILPEIIGNREAMRSQMFRFWYGFGVNLTQWSADWGTSVHYHSTATPVVSMSLVKTRGMIENNPGETEEAKQWQRGIMNDADTIRMVFHCLSSAYQLTEECHMGNGREDWAPLEQERVHELVEAVGQVCKNVAFCLQFPWVTRYIPFFRKRLDKARDKVLVASKRLKEVPLNGLDWIPAIVDTLDTAVGSVVDTIQDGKNWPSYSPISTLPTRFASAFPANFFKMHQEDPDMVFRSFAIRFGITFGVSMIPAMLLEASTSAYWLPLTVGLISFPTTAATYGRVAHRIVGTMLGIAWGAILSQFLEYHPAVLSCFLAINTCCIVGFFNANYAMTTFFVTGWVFTTNVDMGFSLVRLVMYRVIWTAAAAVIVSLAMYLFPARSKYQVTDSIVGMAKVTKEYADVIATHHKLQHSALFAEDGTASTGLEAIEESREKLIPFRDAVQAARIVMTRNISEAVLTPTEGYIVDPHSLAPSLAANLVGASAIVHLTLFVPLVCAEELMVDVDEEAFGEMDRLVRRLEAYTVTPANVEDRPGSHLLKSIHMTKPGRGPFSHAITMVHRRLDLLGVPADAEKEDPEM